MKILKVELKVPKAVGTNTVDPTRDLLYRDIKKRGKKIISHTRELDSPIVEKLNEYKISRFWVKRSYWQWLCPDEARRRNLTLVKMQNVAPEQQRSIERLAAAQTVQSARRFLADFIELKVPPHRKYRGKRLTEGFENLLPILKNLREKIVDIEEPEKRERLLELLQQPPEAIEPVNFPREFQRGFAGRYLDYLGSFLELKFAVAKLILLTEPQLLEQLA